MSNTLDVLSGRLATALRDTSMGVWDSEERDKLITDAVAGLWPRYSRELPYATTTISLVASTYVYSAPAGVMLVSRVDWVDADGNEMGPLTPGSWETVGDPLASALKIHVAPTIADQGGTLRLIGYGRYDLSSNLIPDDYAPLVLATARAEAYRRIAADRVRYKQWASQSQEQNTTVGDLVGFINEADGEAQRLRRQTPKTWQRPVSARHG